MDENKSESPVVTSEPGDKNGQSVLVITLAILVGFLLCVFGYLLGKSDFVFNNPFVNQQNSSELTENVLPPYPPEPPFPLPDNGEIISSSTIYSPLEGTFADQYNDGEEEQKEREERIGLPLDSGYSFKHQSIYYEDEDVAGLDLETAIYVGAGYLKDSKRVFHNGERLLGANPERCTKEAVEQCAESLQWRSFYTPYALDVAWNNGPVSAAEVIPGDSCQNEGYVVGRVENGPLAGGSVLAQDGAFCDMWCSHTTPPTETARYVQFQSYLIPVNAETGFSFSDNRVQFGENLADNLYGDYDNENPKPAVDIPNSDYWLVRASTIGLSTEKDNEDTSEYLFTDPLAGPVYRSSNDCFISERPDHVQVSYRLGFDYEDKSTGVLDFTMLDGTKNSEAYSSSLSYHACYNLVEDSWLNPNERLTKIGKFPNGDPVYKLVNSQDEHLVAKYEDKNTLASYNGGENKYSYDEYLTFNPYLYWQDPFGGWVQLMNRRFETAAEKCKPVVYLYPEKTGDFSVYVKPNGGFTKTIPEYGTGWHVTATPDSQITDKKSGETYPYLYWAGINTGIPEITEGWVVENNQAEAFLVEKLTKLGLNTKEIADFNEYWLPRFKTEGADQYKIMFLPQYLFEPLAPLTVEGDETPESIIRVMMYAQPAQQGEVLPEQILPPTPARTGFTVIEWGGAMFN
jgi:hypothetical protein